MTSHNNPEKFTKYEVTRILGARALQIAMDAPLLLDISKEKLELISYNPMEIAKEELESDVLPITIKQPMPKKKVVKIKKIISEEIKKESTETENMEKKEIGEKGEIMELAIPEDEEQLEEGVSERESSEELQ